MFFTRFVHLYEFTSNSFLQFPNQLDSTTQFYWLWHKTPYKSMLQYVCVIIWKPPYTFFFSFLSQFFFNHDINYRFWTFLINIFCNIWAYWFLLICHFYILIPNIIWLRESVCSAAIFNIEAAQSANKLADSNALWLKYSNPQSITITVTTLCNIDTTT